MSKPFIMAIANHKGGVGKTTTAVTLATGFAIVGHPTFLIDCDPQGDISSFLGQAADYGLYRLIVQERPIGEVVISLADQGYSNLALVPGNARTATIEKLLGDDINTETALRNALKPIRAAYSNNGHKRRTVIILDTAPSLSKMQLSALCAAEWLLIPATPEYASEKGITALAGIVRDLQQQGQDMTLLGILPTMVDSRSAEHKQTISDMKSTFGNLVLPPIRRLIALGEAPRAGKAIWDYAPKSEAAIDYAGVLKEVRKRASL